MEALTLNNENWNRLKKKTAVLVLALIMFTVIPFTLFSKKANAAEWSEADEAARIELCNQRLNDLVILNRIDREIYITNFGLYHAKDVKVYGRRARAVGYDGEYILGGWELLDNTESLHGSEIGGYKLTVPGYYVEFAFSFDISWGTDYPYSGVFWSDIYNSDWREIRIRLDGTCRMADIEIKVDGTTVVSETNCSSHSEWKPD